MSADNKVISIKSLKNNPYGPRAIPDHAECIVLGKKPKLLQEGMVI